jgi:hypothetical protein
VNEVLLYLGGALTIGWGTAHFYPTQKIVRSFGNISRDSQLILTMEWLAEAFLLIFTGLLVILLTARFGAHNTATNGVRRLCRNAARLGWGIGADRRARRLHHVPALRTNLHPLRSAHPYRRIRIGERWTRGFVVPPGGPFTKTRDEIAADSTCASESPPAACGAPKLESPLQGWPFRGCGR